MLHRIQKIILLSSKNIFLVFGKYFCGLQKSIADGQTITVGNKESSEKKKSDIKRSPPFT